MNFKLRLNINYITILLVVFFSTILPAQDIAPSNKDTLSIIAVGDIMMGTDFPRNLLPSKNGRILLDDVKEILQSGDITFGNLEGVFLDGGKPKKKCRDTTICYVFRTPTSFIENLVNSGFDIVSLSNNHSNDFGDTGRVITRQTLSKAGIKYAGIIGETSDLDVNGLKIGVIAFSVSDYCYSILNIKRAQREVSKLKIEFDIVIVSFHGGAEGEDAKHVLGEDEVFYEEERGNVLQFSHAVIDAGADVVIGHGPHVPRALELYKDRLIAYSLGNFCTYRGFSIQNSKGLAPILKVKVDGSGRFIDGQIISARQYRPSGTKLDNRNRAAKLISELTSADFPETNLIINNSGIIKRKIID